MDKNSSVIVKISLLFPPPPLVEEDFALEIIVPDSIELVEYPDKVRFKGTKEDIAVFAKEFFRLKALSNGQICKLGKYTLKISDYITEDSTKKNWIELPSDAWAIMGAMFRDVTYESENNPFDFNDCCYTNRIPFDFGVEVTDLPINNQYT